VQRVSPRSTGPGTSNDDEARPGSEDPEAKHETDTAGVLWFLYGPTFHLNKFSSGCTPFPRPSVSSSRPARRVSTPGGPPQSLFRTWRYTRDGRGGCARGCAPINTSELQKSYAEPLVDVGAHVAVVLPYPIRHQPHCMTVDLRRRSAHEDRPVTPDTPDYLLSRRRPST
jgi:hypothetical protein